MKIKTMSVNINGNLLTTSTLGKITKAKMFCELVKLSEENKALKMIIKEDKESIDSFIEDVILFDENGLEFELELETRKESYNSEARMDSLLIEEVTQKESYNSEAKINSLLIEEVHDMDTDVEDNIYNDYIGMNS